MKRVCGQFQTDSRRVVCLKGVLCVHAIDERMEMEGVFNILNLWGRGFGLNI
jgi:hypothetical protein